MLKDRTSLLAKCKPTLQEIALDVWFFIFSPRNQGPSCILELCNMSWSEPRVFLHGRAFKQMNIAAVRGLICLILTFMDRLHRTHAAYILNDHIYKTQV